MKHFILLLLIASAIQAQNIDKALIIHSDDYYYGTGISYDEKEAKDQALKELTSQIAVHVAHSFERVVSETDGKLEDNVVSILNTHTAAILRNVEAKKNPTSDGHIEVFCFLKKTEVKKIFDERRQLIADMVGKADEYLEIQNLAHALKLYYFASLLLNSLPDENVKFQGINYTMEIPSRINTIIDQIRFYFIKDTMVSEKEREITLKVRHNNISIGLLDFTFWDGANQVSVQARDGLATFRLLGASIKFEELKMNIKTTYYESRREYQVIEKLWDVVQKPIFKSQKTVRLDKTVRLEDESDSPIMPSMVFTEYTYDFYLEHQEDIPVGEKIVHEANRFLEVLNQQDSNHAKTIYGADSFLCTKICDYIKNNHPEPLDKENYGKINKTSNGWELRSVRMLHTYPTIHKQTNEYLVLDFNEEGKLVDFNTSIMDQLYQKFVTQAEYGDDWGNRQVIIKFLEKYRTAYLTRDIKTVDMMFAEEAIIIVGRKLLTKKLPENMVKYQPFGRQPGYEYLKMDKEHYLERQKIIFNSVQDIFLEFSTFKIIRKTKPSSIYGVEMRQSYVSTIYADEGYLFLLIDFDPDTLSDDPLIYVRAWQPNAWSREEMIGTGDFIVHK